jgi:DNA-directed RNA polymerase beta subunit
MYQASKRRNLNGLSPNAFTPYIDRVLKGNPLTSPLEEINPMQLVENARRITKMGPGGIPSDESITEEAQSVHPS